MNEFLASNVVSSRLSIVIFADILFSGFVFIEAAISSLPLSHLPMLGQEVIIYFVFLLIFCCIFIKHAQRPAPGHRRIFCTLGGSTGASCLKILAFFNFNNLMAKNFLSPNC